MRLYIPTSSLNADNILSCESIAPASECRRRKFGYSHFDVLPELRTFANVTLAFSKIPTFRLMIPTGNASPWLSQSILRIWENTKSKPSAHSPTLISLPPPILFQFHRQLLNSFSSTNARRAIRSIAVRTVQNANFSIFTNQGLALLIGTLAEKRYIPI